MRRRDPRRLPRALRGRLVGRAQVPGLPRVGLARARPAPRLVRAARTAGREPLEVLGVDVGGTFTDVVSVREGRIEVTKVPSDPLRPARPVVEGARRLGLEGQAVFNHASTMGLNAVLTRRLPKIGFLTTEGHRDMLDRGRVWRPPDAQTDP